MEYVITARIHLARVTVYWLIRDEVSLSYEPDLPEVQQGLAGSITFNNGNMYHPVIKI